MLYTVVIDGEYRVYTESKEEVNEIIKELNGSFKVEVLINGERA